MSLSRDEILTGGRVGGARLGRGFEPLLEIARGWITEAGQIWIDALGGLRFGPEGFDEIERSGLTMIETTLGAPGDRPSLRNRPCRTSRAGMELQPLPSTKSSMCGGRRPFWKRAGPQDRGMIGFQERDAPQRDLANARVLLQPRASGRCS